MKTNLGSILTTHKLSPKVKIHTYTSPYPAFADSTHIIETENGLILVDAQYLKKYAMEFRDIADRLNKPILGILISHAHPDHVFGLEPAFFDLNIYALPGVIDFLKKNKEYMIEENKKTMGSQIADDILIPTHKLNLGERRIDGVLYKFTKVKDAESDETLVIELPELGVLIPQDLVSSGMHLWLTKDLKHWIEVLKQFKRNPHKLVLGGHGLPTDDSEYDRLIEYLSFSDKLLKKYGKDNVDKISQSLYKRYPTLKGKKFIPMSLSYM